MGSIKHAPGCSCCGGGILVPGDCCSGFDMFSAPQAWIEEPCDPLAIYGDLFVRTTSSIHAVSPLCAALAGGVVISHRAGSHLSPNGGSDEQCEWWDDFTLELSCSPAGTYYARVWAEFGLELVGSEFWPKLFVGVVLRKQPADPFTTTGPTFPGDTFRADEATQATPFDLTSEIVAGGWRVSAA